MRVEARDSCARFHYKTTAFYVNKPLKFGTIPLTTIQRAIFFPNTITKLAHANIIGASVRELAKINSIIGESELGKRPALVLLNPKVFRADK